MGQSLYAQMRYALDPNQAEVLQSFKLNSLNSATFYTEDNWHKQFIIWQQEAVKSGYFLFDLTVSEKKDSVIFHRIELGPHFEGIYLQSNGSSIGPFNADEIQAIMHDTLDTYVNSGFPFASVHLKYLSGEIPMAQMDVRTGPSVRWGQVKVKPDGIIQPVVLQKMLAIYPNEAFSKRTLDAIQLRVQSDFPFKLIRAPEWSLSDGKADVFLYLERLKVSSATGILGLQPNPTTQQASLVGELNVLLQNYWQKNEKLQVQWRSIAPQTQQLQGKLFWPYIAGSAYGVNCSFALYKRDTTFLEVKSNLGINYLFNHHWQLSAALDYWQSNTLAQSNLSSLKSFRTLTYGIGVKREVLDYIQNPRKGMTLEVNYLVGNRRSDNTILTWRFNLTQRYFIPLLKRHVICWSQQLNHIQAPVLFQNELYRYGGLDRMRGFDEEAFFASTVAYTGLEYRYLLDINSYALIFTDVAWSENLVNLQQNQKLYAVGLGLVLGTANGQFKLNYALGTTFSQGLKFNAGKLHLGYISYF